MQDVIAAGHGLNCNNSNEILSRKPTCALCGNNKPENGMKKGSKWICECFCASLEEFEDILMVFTFYF